MEFNVGVVNGDYSIGGEGNWPQFAARYDFAERDRVAIYLFSLVDAPAEICFAILRHQVEIPKPQTKVLVTVPPEKSKPKTTVTITKPKRKAENEPPSTAERHRTSKQPKTGKGRPTMEFPTRMRVDPRSATGFAYEDGSLKIIHPDIKTGNILLDFNFEAKVADFGLAKITSELSTNVSTRVMGTFGHLAPEYASSGKLTDKLDVFSFRVMLLEMVTGCRPVDSAQTFMDDGLVDWARPLLTRALEDRNFDTLVDSRLQKYYNQSEMSSMVACTAACFRHSARRRPQMSQVVRALEGDLDTAQSTVRMEFQTMIHNITRT